MMFSSTLALHYPCAEFRLCDQVIAIAAGDPMFDKLHDIGDVEKLMPGKVGTQHQKFLALSLPFAKILQGSSQQCFEQ
jgi:hypothetical protein